METRKARPMFTYKIPKPAEPISHKTKTKPKLRKVIKSSSVTTSRTRRSVLSLSPSSISPPFNHLYERDNPHRCLICLDLGTSKIEVAYAINSEKNTDPLRVNVGRFQLQQGFSRFPALIGIKPIGPNPTTRAELIFGRDVELALRNQSIDLDHVWSDLKQGRHLIDPDDPAFEAKRTALHETQRKHVRTLRILQKFQEVSVRYPRDSKETIYRNTGHKPGSQYFESVEDVFCMLLRWTIDYVKSAFSSAAGIGIEGHAEVDRLFHSTSVQIGVAVPDMLPPSSVTKYYELLLRSGFHQSVHMLSEAKCAAIKVARDRFSDNGSLKSLKSCMDRDIDVCDIGHGTTDMSTIRIAQKGSLLQFEFVMDAAGNASGGKTIEDCMIAELRILFRDRLKAFIPRDYEDNVKIEEEVFLEGFRQGIAEAKCDFKDNSHHVSVTYYGPGRFPRKLSVDDIQIGSRAIVVPAQMLRDCYDRFLKPIIHISQNSSESRGLLQQHYSAVVSQGHDNNERFFFLVGGGSVPRYTQDRIRTALRNIAVTKHAEVAVPSERSEAFVAEGGVLMLCDQRLCKRRFHNESLGCVMQSADNPDGIDRVNWFYMIGQRIDDRKDIDEVFHYTIELSDGEDPSEDAFVYPVEFKWQLARTINEKFGQIQFSNARHPEIRLDQYIEHQMNRELCEFIGWRPGEVEFCLLFSFKLQVRLSGHVVSFKVTIPEGGTFDDDVVDQSTQSFERLMTANISHLRDEDRYREK